MTRHRLDWLSLLVGLLGVGVAVSALTELDLGAITVAVGPAVAVVAGLALLVAALRSSRGQQATAPGAVAATQPTDARAEPQPSPEPARPARPARPELTPASAAADLQQGSISAPESEVTRRLPADDGSGRGAGGDTDRLDPPREGESA